MAHVLVSDRFLDPGSTRFEREVLERLSALGILRVWILCTDGDPVAWCSGYVRDRHLYADLLVHAPEYGAYSVGGILLGRIIETCISEGILDLDLSRGEEAYKTRWGGQRRDNVRLILSRTGSPAPLRSLSAASTGACPGARPFGVSTIPCAGVGDPAPAHENRR